MTPFLEVLFDLSHSTGHKLYQDKNNACKLIATDHLHVQLEIDPHQEFLLVACMIVEILPGRFQESVIKHALAANAEFPLDYGSLSYVPKNSSLALTELIPIKIFKGEKLSHYLKHFIEKAERWRLAIHMGRPGPDQLPTADSKKPNPFGHIR